MSERPRESVRDVAFALMIVTGSWLILIPLALILRGVVWGLDWTTDQWRKRHGRWERLLVTVPATCFAVMAWGVLWGAYWIMVPIWRWRKRSHGR